MLDRPAINRGPMLRYILLSVFALLLLTALVLTVCGYGQNGQLGGKVTDNGSQPTKSDTSVVGWDVAQFLRHPIPKSCHECNLTMADLSGAKLSLVDLSGTQLYMANLSGADLSGANLKDALLQEALLQEANLSGADLSGAKLYMANLSGADLSGANLTETDFFEANLDGVIGADLSGALNVPARYR